MEDVGLGQVRTFGISPRLHAEEELMKDISRWTVHNIHLRASAFIDHGGSNFTKTSPGFKFELPVHKDRAIEYCNTAPLTMLTRMLLNHPTAPPTIYTYPSSLRAVRSQALHH